LQTRGDIASINLVHRSVVERLPITIQVPLPLEVGSGLLGLPGVLQILLGDCLEGHGGPGLPLLPLGLMVLSEVCLRQDLLRSLPSRLGIEG
jgi:hypothetical protein